MLQTRSVYLLPDGTAKTKLATLVFLYCGEFVKTSNAVSSVNHQSEIQYKYNLLVPD